MEQKSPGKQLVNTCVVIVCGGFLWSMSNVIGAMVLTPPQLVLSSTPIFVAMALFNVLVLALIWGAISTIATLMDYDADHPIAE